MVTYNVSGRAFTKTGFKRWSAALAWLIDKATKENCTVDYEPRNKGFCGTWDVLFTDEGATSPTRLYTISRVD